MFVKQGPVASCTRSASFPQIEREMSIADTMSLIRHFLLPFFLCSFAIPVIAEQAAHRPQSSLWPKSATQERLDSLVRQIFKEGSPHSSDPGVALGQQLSNSSNPDPTPGSTSFELFGDYPTSSIPQTLKDTILQKTVNYAGAMYCPAVQAGRWDCGTYCDANPDFVLDVFGGDGNSDPHYIVGWNPRTKEIVVSHEGSNFTHLNMYINDFNFAPSLLDGDLASTLSGVARSRSKSSVPAGPLELWLPSRLTGDSDVDFALVHTGFQSTWRRTYPAIKASVLRLTQLHPDTASIFVTGHSLGSAVAVLDGIALRSVVSNSIGFESELCLLSHSHHKDVVPHLGPLIMGYQHSQNEIFITQSNSTYDTKTVLCQGQENTNCALGQLQLGTLDHGGPYLGVRIGAGLC
ncbi:hypothetical protein CF326_g5674 [Tilletia indica]|nr:hypothetical protein CF326_g5674 [Tilletia indica]